MSSIPANAAQRPLFNPGINTTQAVTTLLNADRISGDGDQTLGRGEMLRYGEYMTQQVNTWQAWHQFLDWFGFGFLVENSLRQAEAEQQRIAFITDHAADFSGADGNPYTISAQDLRLVGAQDGRPEWISDTDFKTANQLGAATNRIVTTLLAADKTTGDGDQNLGRGEMLRYGDKVAADLAAARQAGNQTEIARLADEQVAIQFIIDHAADFSGADGNGATISAKDIQLVAARDGNAANLSGLDFKPFTPQPGGNREQQLRDYFNSPAFQKLNLSASDSIRLLYTIVLEREPDLGGQQFWEGRLQNGMPLGSIVEAFINSPEYKERFSPRAA